MTTSLAVPPAAVLILGGLILPLLQERHRQIILLVLPLITLYLVWQVPDGVALEYRFLGYTLALVKGDALSRLFATVFAVMAFAGGLFALNQRRVVELAAACCYAGSAIGIAFAGDLLTVFIFWELMALASTLVVWSAGPSARGAGLRYAAVHLLGGVLLMAGIAGEIASTGSLAFGKLALDTVPRWLILAGFLINAGAPPLSAWLPDAYPESSWSGMVFLSAFTTKAAVYVLLRAFPGTELLIYVGLFMVFYGIIYAILENDMRRILAYSHRQPGRLHGDRHRHRHRDGAQRRRRPRLRAYHLQGAAADVGGLRTLHDRQAQMHRSRRTVPHHAADHDLRHRRGAVDLFVPADVRLRDEIDDLRGRRHAATGSRLVPAGGGLCRRFPARRHQVPVVRLLPEGFRAAAAGPALEHAACDDFLCGPLHRLGVWPRPLYAHAAVRGGLRALHGEPCSVHLQLLLFSGLAFFLMLGWLKRTLTITLDVDWFYRKPGPLLARRLDQSLDTAWLGIAKAAARGARGLVGVIQRASRAGGHSRPHLADRQHGVLEHDHSRGLSGPVVLNSGLRWRRG